MNLLQDVPKFDDFLANLEKKKQKVLNSEENSPNLTSKNDDIQRDEIRQNLEKRKMVSNYVIGHVNDVIYEA